MQRKENKRKIMYQEPCMEIWEINDMPHTIVEVSSWTGGGENVEVKRSF